jgi:tRNA-specific 2-thiouridylase
LGLGGGPWYVVKKDLPANIVYVAHMDTYLGHARHEFTVANLHWIHDPPEEGEAMLTKVRHTPRLERCSLRRLGAEKWEVTLAEKDQGIAAGQSAVFYRGEYCLGSGVIE